MEFKASLLLLALFFVAAVTKPLRSLGSILTSDDPQLHPSSLCHYFLFFPPTFPLYTYHFASTE